MRKYKVVLVLITLTVSIFSLILIFGKREIELDKNTDRSTWPEMVAFAQNNKKEIDQVSKVILKYIDLISLDKLPVDYETLISTENEAVKKGFRKVFKTVGLSYETIAYKEKKQVYLFYKCVDGTTYEIIYFSEENEEKQNFIASMKGLGEVVQITSEIYVYHYKLNYT